MLFTLLDTFNHRIISRHRKLENAVKAKAGHLAAVRRANGVNSYLPLEIQGADYNELIEAENNVFNK